MEEIIDLGKYYWGGMLSAWGQGKMCHTGACYSDLNFNAKYYIPEIAKGAPPVVKYFLKFNNLEMDEANGWLRYLVKHVVPDEVLEHVSFTRIKLKKDLPRILQSSTRNDGALGMWLKAEFQQDLCGSDIFVLGVLLRYVSEHARVCKMIALLPELAPGLPEEMYMTVASHIGNASGHAVGMTMVLPKTGLKAYLTKFNWKDMWRTMRAKQKPFYEVPKKEYNIDRYFSLDVRYTASFHSPAYNATFISERTGKTYKFPHSDPTGLFAALNKEFPCA